MVDPPSIDNDDNAVRHSPFCKTSLKEFLEDKAIGQNFNNLQLPIERSSSKMSSSHSIGQESSFKIG